MAGLTDASPYALLAARYGRAFDFAVVFVVAGWQVAGEGSQLFADRAAYGSDTVQAAAWIALDVAVAAGGLRLLGIGRAQAAPAPQTSAAWAGAAAGPGRAWAWTLAAAGLAVGGVAAAMCPHGAMLKTDWAWGSAGWVAVLALIRRPLRELCGFLALDALITFAILTRDGLHRPDLAGFLTILVGSASIQLAVSTAAHALDSVARQAADAARAEAAAREAAAIAELVDAARRARIRALQETAGPLIQGLAADSCDPGDAEVRRQCAVEAARLRRLMAESDDAATPLLHELHASAETAARSGVALDLEVAGALPDIPADVRRAMTDTAIAVLATARSRARITVTADADSVAVSLVADSPAPPELPASLPAALRVSLPAALPAARAGSGSPVVVDMQRDNLDLWVEARWTPR